MMRGMRFVSLRNEEGREREKKGGVGLSAG